MRLMILSANMAGAVYSGGFHLMPPTGEDGSLPIGAAAGELLVWDATLWADPANIAGYAEHRADGGRGRRNMPNGLIVNGARFVSGLRLRVEEEGGQALPVRITRLVSNHRVTDYRAETPDGLCLSGELFTWGAPDSHDSAALYLSITVENRSACHRTVRVGVEQPTPDFHDLYALRGYLDESGPVSQVRVVSGGFNGLGPVYPDRPRQDDPWVRLLRVSVDDLPCFDDPHTPGRAMQLAPGASARLSVAMQAYTCPKEQEYTCTEQFAQPFETARQQLDQGFYGFVSRQTQFFCETASASACTRLNHLTLSARQDLWPLLIPYKTDNMADALQVFTAGTPDFRTLFGRDSLIAILLGNLPQDLARNIIRAHSANLNAAGFIPHELNFGPRINETPFNFVTHMLGQDCQAYDAQNLYLLALNRLWCDSGDPAVILDHWNDIQRIRMWNDQEIRTHGIIAYTRDGQNSLLDKGWMDGGHAIRWPDGEAFSRYPKATVELQALYYKGIETEIRWLETPAIAERLAIRGIPVDERLRELGDKASCFRQQFENLFWDEERGFYSQAVGWDDGRKCWVRNGVLASNIHYLIGSGLVRGERLRATVQQVSDPAWGLFNPHVGIRTVSNRAAFYDPEAYQQGSSWTFDTALAALHLKQQRRASLRTGDSAGAALCSTGLATYTQALFQVFTSGGSHFAEHLHGDTGAELLSGNTPQLWSIAAWLRTESLLMGLEVDARHGDIHLNPSRRLQAFTLLNVPAGAGRISLRYQAGADTPVEVMENTSGCRVFLHEREPAAVPDRDVWRRGSKCEHPQTVQDHAGSVRDNRGGYSRRVRCGDGLF